MRQGRTTDHENPLHVFPTTCEDRAGIFEGVSCLQDKKRQTRVSAPHREHRNAGVRACVEGMGSVRPSRPGANWRYIKTEGANVYVDLPAMRARSASGLQ